MNLLHMFDATEKRLAAVNDALMNPHGIKAEREVLKDEKEYLLDILDMLFIELES